MTNTNALGDNDKIQKAVDDNFNKKKPKFSLSTSKGIRHHFRHYPKDVQDTAVEYLLAPFKKGKTRGNLVIIIKAILEHYSPASDIITSEGKPTVDFASLDEDSEIIADFGMDSLSLMEIAFFIEEVLDLRIENEKILEIVTLGDVVNMVEQTQEEQEGIDWPEVHLGGADAQNPGPEDPAMAHKKYKIGWVPNPKNTTAFLECNTPVIDMSDAETIKKYKKASDEGRIKTTEDMQKFIEEELTPKPKRKYTKKSDYWKKKKK
jgi:acyl carrier protein